MPEPVEIPGGPVPEAAVDAEIASLLGFAARSRVPGGFASLDAAGAVPPGEPLALWVTCRMTHVFGLASLLGPHHEHARDLLDHGVEALLGPWRDPEHDGWWSALVADGTAPAEARKEAYAHAFVVLAGVTATAADHPRGPELLDAALAVLRQRFWEEGPGMVADAWDAGFTRCDPYRGLNATMHTLEALLAVHDLTGDAWSLEASLRIAARVADVLGPAYAWRLPEHFDADWTPLPDYHRDLPRDPFRPYGATVGHLLEWARLLLHLDLAVRRQPAGGAGSADLGAAARALIDRAVADGWAVDGADGFVYTVDFEGRPVVRERMHWVIAEAVANAALRRSVGLDEQAAEDHRRWLAFAWSHHRDPVGGSWWHELGTGLVPSGTVWPGKPDVYHALQALWLPRLAGVEGGCVSFAGAARRAGDPATPADTPGSL